MVREAWFAPFLNLTKVEGTRSTQTLYVRHRGLSIDKAAKRNLDSGPNGVCPRGLTSLLQQVVVDFDQSLAHRPKYILKTDSYIRDRRSGSIDGCKRPSSIARAAGLVKQMGGGQRLVGFTP